MNTTLLALDISQLLECGDALEEATMEAITLSSGLARLNAYKPMGAISPLPPVMTDEL